MEIALQEAHKALSEGEVPVGAVLVSEQKVVVSTRNRKEAVHDPTAHAELMAIRKGTALRGDWRLESATLYVTKEPCIMCAGAMLNARLGRLVFGCSDTRFGAVNSRYQLLHDPGLNHRVRVKAGVLEEKCSAILREFFNLRR